MTPDDFLTLALRLATNAGEAERRSAVSRAYYGAFHAALHLVQSCGVQLPETAEAHKKLIFCLQTINHAPLTQAGGKLNSLREARNHADYRLKDERFRDGKYVAVHVAAGQQIVQATNDERGIVLAEAKNIRDYARTVLKIPIDET